MLFKKNKAKNIALFQKVATEDAKEFKRTMRNTNADVYTCVINFVGQSSVEEAIIGYLLLQYSKFANIALEDYSKELTKHSLHNLAINLVEDAVLPYCLLYRLLEAELVVLQKYLANFIARGQIYCLRSLVGAPILFVKKKDSSLKLCVDF